MDEIGNLLVTRKHGQRVFLNFGKIEIVVKLVSAARGEAKFRIEAPKSVSIEREELREGKI